MVHSWNTSVDCLKNQYHRTPFNTLHAMDTHATDHTTLSQLSTPSNGTCGIGSIRTVAQWALFGFFAVPAVFFWLMGGLLVIGVAGLIASDEEESTSCNVARIPLQGIVVASDDGVGTLLGLGGFVSADTIADEITAADDDDTIQAIVLDVDSPGGTPVGGDEIMQALLGAKKPTVAVVRDMGASAAYWAAAGADRIIASPVSDVGSIGVTMSYREVADSKETEGSRWISLSSGSFKDAGNPERPLTDEEQAYFQGQVDVVHKHMVERIAGARTAISRTELEALADGRAFIGTEALALKLVDELGGFAEARRYLERELGLNDGEAVLCDASRGGIAAWFE